MNEYRWKLTVNVTHDDYASVMELARKARTSPSALLQHCIRQMIADGANAIPLVPPADTLPREVPSRLSLQGTARGGPFNEDDWPPRS